VHPALPRATSGSPPDSVLSRRRVLVHGSRGMLALVTLAALLPACSSDQAAGPEPLEPELAAARSDAALAAAAADAAPALAPALRVIADERNRHAAALVEELARAAGKPTPAADSPGATASATASATAAPSPNPPPGVREVADALRRSADSAAKLVPTLSGYRAGLLGSIAAACTAAHTVGLAPAGQSR